MTSPASIRLWHDPEPADIAADVADFLEQLGGPTAILLSGRDSSRCRAAITLLHGNEPSGLIALHRYLRNFRQPAVNILLFFGAVAAARHGGLFVHRMIPGERDQNRCFGTPHGDDRPGRIAAELLDLLRELAPESLIDIHNTSGRSGAFGVVSHEDDRHEALVTLFSQRLIVTGLHLGALMEISSDACPAVTIECGGAASEDSIEVAWQGLQKYIFEDQLAAAPSSNLPMDIYHCPARLELRGDDFRLEFANAPVDGADLTIPLDIEDLNFGVVETTQLLGWLGPRGSVAIRLVAADGERSLDGLLTIRNGALYPAQALKLFMITTNPVIARSDCLLYLAPESDHTHLDWRRAELSTPAFIT